MVTVAIGGFWVVVMVDLGCEINFYWVYGLWVYRYR